MFSYAPTSDKGLAWLARHGVGLKVDDRYYLDSTLRMEWLEYKMRRDKIRLAVHCKGFCQGRARGKRRAAAVRPGRAARA